MLLVDSSVWIDYFNGVKNERTDYLDRILDQVPILVGDLILAEVLQGFQKDSDFDRVRQLLLNFTQVEMLNPVRAVQSARNYRSLRKKGYTVRKTIDSLIATFCIEQNHELLHNDHDFDGYEKHLGLKVIHP
jgi:predicted nucleic acid-binding protein